MQVKKKLLDLVRDKIYPIEMGKIEIESYLTKLAAKDRVSPTTCVNRIHSFSAFDIWLWT